jgi:membrane fusion protein (multidrug efflux system)
MKLLEKIKTKVTAIAVALWAWMLAKAVEWKLRDRLIALWEKTKGFWVRLRERFMRSKINAKLQSMTPLGRRMTIMLCGVFLLLGLIFGFNQPSNHQHYIFFLYIRILNRMNWVANYTDICHFLVN